jgi:hypothetical protein
MLALDTQLNSTLVMNTYTILLNSNYYLMKKFFVISSLFVLPCASTLYYFKDDMFSKIFRSNKTPKDETRYNSNYYGINWGSKTDELVFSLFIFD